MNGLKAFYQIRENNFEGTILFEQEKERYFNIVERDLKVLNILKEKKVDLHWIMRQWSLFYLAIEDGSSWISPLLFDYNERFGTANPHLHLTLEEITLIVDWIRGEL